jgi:hypothetical protein
MAYDPTVWVDDDGSNQVGTEFTAARMNKIEQGLAEASLGGGGGGGHQIMDEGVALTARARLNFVGTGVTASDDALNGRTLVTIPGITVAAMHTKGGATVNHPGGATEAILPVGTIVDREPADAFTINADGTVTVKDAGWYDISASVYGQSNPVYHIKILIARLGFVSELFGQDGNGYIGTVARAVKLLAGEVVSITFGASVGAPANVREFSIARVGGPKGDTGGNATVPMENWITVGAAGAPAYVAPWTGTMRFRKDPLGRVQLDGQLSGGTSGTLAFTLPSGYAPDASGFYDCLLGGGGATYVNINAFGQVIPYFGAVGGWLSGLCWDTGTVTQMPTGPVGPQGPPGNSVTVPIEGWRVLGQPGNPALNAGFTMLDEIGFQKDPLGKVHLRGSFSTAPGNGTVAFTLPAGYRPPQRYRGIAIQNQVAAGQWEGQININADGTVVVYYTGPGATAYVSLDQIEFDTGTVTQMPTGPQGPKGDPGGLTVIKTLNWNTAVQPGFYYGGPGEFPGPDTINGPGDPINAPLTAGIVSVSVSGATTLLVQRVWDVSAQRAYTRYMKYDGTFTAWVPDLSAPPIVPEAAIGGPTPLEGDERYLQTAAMKTQGVIWKFRYDKTAPAGKPAWLFVGGSPYYIRNDTDGFAPASGVWGDVGGVLGWTAPVQGDFEIEFGALIYSNIPGTYVQMTMSVAGVVDDTHSLMHGNFGAGYTDYGDRSRTNRYDNVQSGQLVKAVHQSTPGTGGGYQKRYMKITPVRVIL